MQRAFKRQKSNVAAAAANGELPVIASPDGGPPGADFVAKCWDVFQKVVSEIPPREQYYGVTARDVWFRTVQETFPAVAHLYYAAIPNPRTLGEIQHKLRAGRYTNPQDFAEVGLASCWGRHGAGRRQLGPHAMRMAHHAKCGANQALPERGHR